MLKKKKINIILLFLISLLSNTLFSQKISFNDTFCEWAKSPYLGQKEYINMMKSVRSYYLLSQIFDSSKSVNLEEVDFNHNFFGESYLFDGYTNLIEVIPVLDTIGVRNYSLWKIKLFENRYFNYVKCNYMMIGNYHDTTFNNRSINILVAYDTNDNRDFFYVISGTSYITPYLYSFISEKNKPLEYNLEKYILTRLYCYNANSAKLINRKKNKYFYKVNCMNYKGQEKNIEISFTYKDKFPRIENWEIRIN